MIMTLTNSVIVRLWCFSVYPIGSSSSLQSSTREGLLLKHGGCECIELCGGRFTDKGITNHDVNLANI